MKSATIYDVAREAGVSIKTVSRILNHDMTVKPANRERVLAAVDRLNYRPSLSARSLAGSKSFVVAAFVDAQLTIDHWRSGRATDYLARVQLGATLECRKAGYHFLLELIDHDRASLTREARDVLAALSPDGVLLTPPSCDDPDMLELLTTSRTPFVRLGSESEVEGGIQLTLDDRGGAATAVRHLLGLGHTRIACILGDPRYGSSQARLAGYRQAMAEAGLEPDDALVLSGDFTFQSGVAATQALLAGPAPPTAIFASSDEMALGCLSALDQAGLRVPSDVSVVGFDDSAGSRFSRPQLTTVRQPLIEMASEAVRRLIQKPATEQDSAQAFTSELIVRDSTAPPKPMPRRAAG